VIRPKRKSGTSVWPNLSNKPLVLVGRAIDGQLKLFMEQCIPNKRRTETVTNEALTMIKTD
jgi:hypothetical protein